MCSAKGGQASNAPTVYPSLLNASASAGATAGVEDVGTGRECVKETLLHCEHVKGQRVGGVLLC